jgi:hypothetical protein
LGGTNFRPLVYSDFDNKEIMRIDVSNITSSVNINGSTAAFSGLISANTAPTLGQHLTNKTYVDTQIVT